MDRQDLQLSSRKDFVHVRQETMSYCSIVIVIVVGLFDLVGCLSIRNTDVLMETLIRPTAP